MTCHCCAAKAQRFGTFRNRNRLVQRYRCPKCGGTFSEIQPLDGSRVDFDKSCQVVNMLCEGMGVRAAARLTNLHRDTVLSILEMAGAKMASFSDAHVLKVKANHVQIDELFTYVYSKPQNTIQGDPLRGEFFTFLSVERDSKLIINWRVGKRDQPNAVKFLQDLRARVLPGFALTSDCFAGYVGKEDRGNVKYVFGTQDITYSTEMKVWGKRILSDLPSRYFNPMIVVGIKRQQRIGQPDLSQSTICHAERTNLSVRTFTRRFTRCTIGYSKKVENLRHAVAMFVTHFNFCRVHSAHGETPAMAAGLTDHKWTIEELLKA